MTVSIRSATAEDARDVARLCWADRDLLLMWSSEFPEMVQFYYGADSYAALIIDLPRIHARPKGDILLATVDSKVIDCAMYYPFKIKGVTEVKRVFVDKTARGTGAGEALLRATMQAAQSDGYTRVVLDTVTTLTEAIALYRRIGFQHCAPYYETNPDFMPYLRSFDHPL